MPRPREQAVLARLALSVARPVPIDVLVADVWGPDAAATAVDALRVHVSNLRKLLQCRGRSARELLRTTPGGYLVDLPRTAVDVERLERALGEGETAMLWDAAATWSDDDLGRFDAGSGFFDAAARRIEELRLAAVEAVALAGVDAEPPGRTEMVLEAALRRSPHRERLWELLVRTLAGAGRRTDALRAFQRARSALAEVGMQPGEGLAAAETSVIDDLRAVRTRPETRYVDVGGSRVAYATVGSGEMDLLFLHGGFVPFEIMDEAPRLAAFLDELAARFRVVLVDRRGIGMSDGPPGGVPVTIDHWVEDCVAVLGAIGARQVVVFGHEHAGPVAIRLAAEHGARVRGLVLHSTAARPLRGPDHPYGPTEESLERIDRMIDGLPGADELMTTVAPSAGRDPALRAWLERAGRLGAGPARARELHRTYRFADVRAALPAVGVATEVLHPARLVRTDPGQARYLADHIPDAGLLLLDSADHLFWLRDADAVLAAIDRVVERAKVAVTRSGSGRRPPPPVRLRALVAAAPDVAPDDLARLGAETTATVGDVVVASFATRAAADVAAAALRAAHPAVTTVVDVADTTAEPTDPAVTAIARRAAPP